MRLQVVSFVIAILCTAGGGGGGWGNAVTAASTTTATAAAASASDSDPQQQPQRELQGAGALPPPDDASAPTTTDAAAAPTATDAAAAPAAAPAATDGAAAPAAVTNTTTSAANTTSATTATSDGGATTTTTTTITTTTVVTVTKSIRDIIVERPELTDFKAFLESINMLDQMFDDDTKNYTLFAPTNQAMADDTNIQRYLYKMDDDPPRWSQHMIATVKNHVLENQVLTKAEIFDQERTELTSMLDTWTVSQWSSQVGGATIETPDLLATNGIMHIVANIVKPEFYQDSFARLELQEEFGPDWLNRTSMITVVDFVKGRQTLSMTKQEGLTYAGCRIRGFNQIGHSYLFYDILGNKTNMADSELLNDTMIDHTLHQFVEYQLIPQTLYLPEIKKGYTQLFTPVAGCAHMWVTNLNNKLCFNDGCIVATPDPRWFLASNGVGYVLDRCLVCPGVGMMVDYAAEFTTMNMRDTAQLLVGTEWNLRNLSYQIGDGGPVTLFAAINTAYEKYFTLEDTTRLSTDKWRRHLWDLCKHYMVQGIYSESRLKDMYLNQTKKYNITMLTGQNVTIDYDSKRNMVLVNGGDLFFGNIKAIDGLAHFITEVPMPRSVTHNCYTIVEDDPLQRFTTHQGYLQTMFLEEDVKRLLPLTVFYVPNDILNGLKFKSTELPALMENHVFKELMWCEKLLEMAADNEPIESHNGRLWYIKVNDKGQPCIDTITYVGDLSVRACVVECDILARNGIVHILDNVLIKEAVATVPPRKPTPPLPPSAAAPPTVSFSDPKYPSETQAPKSAPKSGAAAMAATAYLSSWFMVMMANVCGMLAMSMMMMG